MNKLKLFTIGGVVCAAISISAAPVNAQWPTYDPSAVMQVSNGLSDQLKSIKSTMESTLNISQMREAIGDSVGSLSKFKDAAEKAKKAKEKLEKQRKRMEHLAKLKEKYDKAQSMYDDAKGYADSAKGYADSAKDLYGQGKEAYGEAKSQYEQGMAAYDEYSSAAQSYLNSGKAEPEIMPDSSAPAQKEDTLEAKPSIPATQDTKNLIEVEEGNFAELVADKEFSEGSWNGEDFTAAPETPAEILPAKPVVAPEISVGRRPFIKDMPVAIKDKAPVGELKKLPVNQAVKTDAFVTLPTVEKAVEVKQISPSVAPAVKKAVEVKQISPSVAPAVKKAVEVKKVSPSVTPTVEKTLPVRKAFKTMKVSMKLDSSLAFAQMSSFKTGTNDDGKFIFSDEIANKCGMNYDKFSEDDVANCVKTFVMGLNHDNAQDAQEWLKVYKNSLHDHYAADLATALLQKGYSASFESEVADDLDNKSEALASEREEISFAGKINQVNQEVIIRLMEAMAGQVVTDSWAAIENLDRRYYEDEGSGE